MKRLYLYKTLHLMQVIVAGALGVRSAGLYASRCMVRLHFVDVTTYYTGLRFKKN